MEKKGLKQIIQEELEKETEQISMSFALKEKIRRKTIYRKDRFWDKIRKVMEKPVEASLYGVTSACIVLLLVLIPLSSMVTENMKRDDAIFGYTNVTVVNVGGTDVLVDKREEVNPIEGATLLRGETK